MMRKLVLASMAAVVGMAVGCKDSGPTSMKFDPAKGGYDTQNQQYTKGAGTGGAQTTTTTSP